MNSFELNPFVPRSVEERLVLFDRAMQALREAVREADTDVIVLLDLARSLLGAANRLASDGLVDEREWLQALRDITVAGAELWGNWVGMDTDGVAAVICEQLDRRDFERTTLDDLDDLPEIP